MSTFKRKLRAGVLGMTLAGGVAAWPAYACGGEPGEGSKQSDIGAFSGLVIGAFAAGPFGAVAGAAAGALLGDRYHRQAQSKAALAADLERSEAERGRLSASVAQLDGSLTRAQAHGVQLDQTVQNTDELGLDVAFRTADDSISTQALPPLLKLGALATSLPQARVRVDGYADPRGSEDYNDALSLRRAQGVAAALMSAGVPPERIRVEAHGKSTSESAAGDLDAYALERRVTVRLEMPRGGEVASRD
jgi:outer membrane protein OmpA-like peptidoglycan-associated protein